MQPLRKPTMEKNDKEDSQRKDDNRNNSVSKDTNSEGADAQDVEFLDADEQVLVIDESKVSDEDADLARKKIRTV